MPATRTTECRWQRLTAALAQADRAGGHRLDSQQILDLLWMATLLAADIRNQPTPPQPPASPPAPESAGDSPSTPAAPDSTSPPPPDGSPPDRGPLAPTQDAPEDDPKIPLDPAIGNQTQAGGWPRVSVAEPGLLPHPRRLGRALAPLNRQVETGSACHLDVPATVEAIARARAERGPWQPVLLPRRQGWLALHLVFDGHTSMVVWERLRRELPRCLSQQVQWRDLRCWTLSRNPGGTMELRGVNGRPGAPGQLRRPGGRDLVLVVSDLLAPSWRDGAMAAVLHDWAEVQPVLLLQVLPSRLWRRTGLTAAEGGWVQARQPLQHHARLQWQPLEERPFWPEDATASPPPGTVTLPLTTLDPRDLAAMAGLLTAAGGNSLRGFRFELSALASVPPEQPATSPPPPSHIPPAPPSDQRIEELLAVFLFTASLDARRLLALLTYAPLITLPVVRLVLNQQGGAGGPAVIAEVLFSGLFRNVETASTTKVPIDQQQLCFVDEVPGEHLREGLRERLREGLRVGQARAVFQAVEQYVAQSLGLSVQGFEALLRDPNAAPLPGEQLSDQGRDILRAFAMVSIRCLRGLGPDFEQRADVYETTWATAAAEEIPEKGTMGGLDLEPELTDPSSGSVSVQTASGESIVHLHIYGPTGIGKTRLALELCRQAAWADFVIYVPRALNVDLLNLLHGFAEGGNSTSRSSSGSNSSASITDSSGPSKAMQIANLSLSVSPERIARLTDIELGELMAQLLKAQSYICGAPVSEVRIESDELLRDHGEVAWTGKPKTPDEWLGDAKTCWQLKAGDAGEPAKVKNEILKPLPHDTLTKGGRFVLVASGSTSGMKGETVRLRALTAEAAAAGLPTDRIVVIGSERLAEWVNQHPAIAARWVNQPEGVWTLKNWTEQNGHEAPWQAKHSLSKEVEKFRQALDPVRTSKGTHPGVRLVLVADYTPGDRLPALRDALDFYKGRLRLITIGYEPPPETRRIRNLKLEGLDQQNITELVAFWNPSLTDSQVLDVIEVASGNPLHARMAADELSRNPTLNTDELRKRLEERLRGGPERVNFPRNVRLVISQRVGGFCSRPGCNIHTTGPHSEPGKVIDTGVAAHITAATPGGPRFSPYLTNEERKSHDNGIWLCQYHDKLIDSDPETYPEALLREWKAWAEQEQQDRVLGITRGRFDWTWPGAWDFGPYRKERCQGFMGREWLLRKVRAWATDPEAKQAMLIEADFGVGKTAFLAQLIDCAGSGLLVVAQHFCRWEENGYLSPGRFVQSLAAQFKEELPAYRKALENDGATSLRESLNRAEAEPLIAFNQAVVAPLAKIPAPATRRLLVIDALDEALYYRPEAGGNSRYTIVDLLAKEARNLPPWLRVLATIRRRDEVLKPLRQGFFSIEEINFDEEANLADIHDYVKVRCQQEPLAAILNRADLSVSDTADLLQAKSGGKFLYAVRMLNDLASGALTLENRLSLNELPPGMDGFYKAAFERRFPDEASYAAVQPILALLCEQREPLGFKTLAVILGRSVRNVSAALQPLNDLLRFVPVAAEEESGRPDVLCSFDHLSLEQWLSEENEFYQPRAGRFGVDREVAKQKIHTWALAEVAANRAHTSPYLVRHLASHLRDDECAEVIAGQLRQFPWLQARLRLAGIEQLIEDFAIATSNPELMLLERMLNELTQLFGSDDGDADDRAFEQLAVQLREQLPEEGELGALRIQAVEWLANRSGRDEETRARRFAVKDRNTRDLPSRIDTGKMSLNALVDMPRTYTGLLDDSMIRYSSDYIGEDFFNKMIAKNIFFGGGLYINDGYLVNHPIARRYLFNEESLLRVMIDTGFIRIITRASSAQALSQMPLAMAKQGNSSFISLVNSSEWKDFKPFLDRIAQEAFFNNTIRSWPDRDMSFGFTKLMRDRAFAQEEPSNLGIGSVSRDEWLAIRDDFLLRNPEIGGPRDKLEKAALKILAQTRSDPRLAMNAVMTVGNQAYHYNFGLALTVEEQNGVAVDTTIGSAFDELLQIRQIERGQLDNIPLLRLPKNMPLERGDLFLDFLRESTKVGQAKLNYVRSLRNVISGVDFDFDSLKSNLNDATEEYISSIIDRLAPAFGRFTLEEAFDESFTLAVGSLSDKSVDSVTSTAAPTAGLAIEIQATANEKGKQFLIERFKLRNVSEGFDPTDQVIRLGDIKPQIASLAFNGEEAARFIEDIPPAPKS